MLYPLIGIFLFIGLISLISSPLVLLMVIAAIFIFASRML